MTDTWRGTRTSAQATSSNVNNKSTQQPTKCKQQSDIGQKTKKAHNNEQHKIDKSEEWQNQKATWMTGTTNDKQQPTKRDERRATWTHNNKQKKSSSVIIIIITVLSSCCHLSLTSCCFASLASLVIIFLHRLHLVVVIAIVKLSCIVNFSCTGIIVIVHWCHRWVFCLLLNHWGKEKHESKLYVSHRCTHKVTCILVHTSTGCRRLSLPALMSWSLLVLMCLVSQPSGWLSCAYT